MLLERASVELKHVESKEIIQKEFYASAFNADQDFTIWVVDNCNLLVVLRSSFGYSSDVVLWY